MKIRLLMSFLALAAFAACGPAEDDALATYVVDGKSMAITRQAFYASLGQGKDRALSSEAQVEQYLNNFAFEVLKAVEARGAGLDKDPAFAKRLRAVLDERVLLGAFLGAEFPRPPKMGPYRLDAPRIRHIIVKLEDSRTVTVPDPDRYKKMDDARRTVKDARQLEARLKQLETATVQKREKLTPAELAVKDKEALDKIEKLRAETLQTDFSNVAFRKSEDGARARGGDLGILLPRQQNMDPVFTAAAMKLKAGETSGVVKTKFGYHLIKCDEIVTITETTLGKHFPDKMQRENALNGIWFARVWQYIDDTLNNDKLVAYGRDKLGAADPATVVFEIKDPRYPYALTLGEYTKELEKLPPHVLSRYGINRTDADKGKPFTTEERLAYFEWHVTFPVLRYGAYKRNVVEKAETKQEIARLAQSALAQLATERKIGDKPGEAELLREYEQNKKAYVKPNPAGKGEPIQLTFAEAKPQIENRLVAGRRQAVDAQWRAELFSKYKLALDRGKYELKRQLPAKPRDNKKPQQKQQTQGQQKKNK